MNLTETLNVALPEIPVRALRNRYPRMHPKMVARERIEGGQPMVSCVVSGDSNLFRFPPFQWQLLQLFDGQRSYEEVSDVYFEQTGLRLEAAEIRKLAEDLDAVNFWYKTPLETNIALKQRLADERAHKIKKTSKYGDVSRLEFSAWDPDHYLGWLHQKIAFVYTRWFTLLTLAGFVFMSYVFVARWSEIGADTLQFYNFTQKGMGDIAEFWILACIVLFFHETGHGLTCKHYGGGVHRMGFTLIYFTPCFFTDVTEAWVYADKWQRVATIIAGAWTEMLICALATPIWWGTPYGTLVHDIAYKLILITGLGVIFFNYNPLIKLDGYYLLTETIGIPNLKEESTEYASALVKKYLWRLPVVVPYVAKRRRAGYLIYALASGAYSYSLLAFFARFIGNVFHHFTPEWAFVPAWLVGLRLFKSRIQTLVKFMKTVYLDKRDRVGAWFAGPRRIVAGGAAALLLVVPWTRTSVQGRFLLEPAQLTVVRAAVPGTVASVFADEGAALRAGQPILQLRNLQLESDAARAQADLGGANAKLVQAELHYGDLGAAQAEREQVSARTTLLRDELSHLQITSPIAGALLTPRLADRQGSYVTAGTELAQVGSLGQVCARIYVPEYDLRKVAVGAAARLHFDSFLFGSRRGVVTGIAPASEEIAAGLIQSTTYKGIRPPSFYVATIIIDNPDGKLLPGMAGTARIYGERRSVAHMLWNNVADFIQRKVW